MSQSPVGPEESREQQVPSHPSPAGKFFLGPLPGETEIVIKAIDGDQEAFRELMELYYGQIFNLFRRLLGPRREQAADLTQEAFLRAWKGLHTFDLEGRFYTWLRKIAVNYWIQEYRRRTALKRRGTTISIHAPLISKDSGYFLDPPATTLDPGKRAASKELGEAILAALDTLEGPMREAVVLRDLQDLSYEEIAEIMETPIGTVRSRIHRGRALLQEPLKGFMDPGE